MESMATRKKFKISDHKLISLLTGLMLVLGIVVAVRAYVAWFVIKTLFALIYGGLSAVDTITRSLGSGK